MKQPALSIKKFCKTYGNGVCALCEVDLTIVDGQFFGLIGANGAGKSTMIGILTNLVVKSSGTVEIFGVDIDKDPAAARSYVGVVPQELNLNSFEQPLPILINQAGFYGVDRVTARAKAEELLNDLSLWDKRNEDVRHLSGGMKRRLMIGRALVHNPKLLLLDEPTTSLDITLRNSTWDYLQNLNRQGITILLTSHYLEEVEHLCREAALIQNGKILNIDSIENLVASLERQIYIARLSKSLPMEQLQGFDVTPLDDHSLEVVIEAEDTLSNFISVLHGQGIGVKDLRPKRSRLEQLFLNLNE